MNGLQCKLHMLYAHYTTSVAVWTPWYGLIGHQNEWCALQATDVACTLVAVLTHQSSKCKGMSCLLFIYSWVRDEAKAICTSYIYNV